MDLASLSFRPVTLRNSLRRSLQRTCRRFCEDALLVDLIGGGVRRLRKPDHRDVNFATGRLICRHLLT